MKGSRHTANGKRSFLSPINYGFGSVASDGRCQQALIFTGAVLNTFMKDLNDFLNESLEPSGLLKKDELNTFMARIARPDLEDTHVYHANLAGQHIQVTHFRNKGVRELHFTNFTGGMPSVVPPAAGLHTRHAIRLFADMFHIVKPYLDVGEPVKIQSFDDESHNKHMRAIGAILNHKMPSQFEIKHVGNTKSTGFQGGSYPTSLITKK